MTIAEMRAKEVRRLAEYRNENPTAEDLAKAKRMMNSFYRLCGLAERNSIMANVEELYDQKKLERSEQRQIRWSDRLDDDLQDFCGLRLTYCGIYPSIGIVNENGGFTEKVSRFFY